MRNNLSLDQTFSGMSWISHERKMAIAFAMYANITLTEVVNLKWSDTLELNNWKADFILQSVTISESIDNVFWETDEQGNDTRLVSLPYIFGIATMWQDWKVFVKNNSNSIPINFTSSIH